LPREKPDFFSITIWPVKTPSGRGLEDFLDFSGIRKIF